MSNTKYIYIMLSSTRTKFARFIRYTTKAEYSHASVSFTENMEKLYSFGRFYHCMPLIGGLVHETLNRFTLKSPRRVNIKIFKIPVSEESYENAYNRICQIAEDDEYAYNLVSVMTFALKHGVERYKTFVCSEFTSHILRVARPDLASSKPDCKVMPDDFSTLLKGYEVYSGALAEYDKFIDIENEEYFRRFSTYSRVIKTCKFLHHRYWHFSPDNNTVEFDNSKML